MAYKVTDVRFPRFKGIQINMMPIIMGDAKSIPEEFRKYAKLVTACDTEQAGKVGYLTIDESVVESGSHRRGGIHTESPGFLPPEVYGDAFSKSVRVARDWSSISASGAPGDWGARTHWGGGRSNPGTPRDGGIYMASNIADSCVIWNMYLGRGQIGFMGDCRRAVGERLVSESRYPDRFAEKQFSHSLGKNELWWMTDRTPHESMFVSPGTKRQFFRLVTNQVSVWFAKHSTPNPLGIEPDCYVSDTDKFDLIKRFEKEGWDILKKK
jgi:hypothetical protein